MLRFFRKIREKLLTEGKVKSYLLYAVGEILLVVVGILIAFQIDNWNEDRVKRTQEFKILSQIQSDLIENNSEIQEIIDSIEGSKFAADSLIKSLDQKKRISFFPVYSSLIHRKHFYNKAVSGYSILGSGLGTLISNDSIRNSIVQLYETDLSNIETRQAIMFDHLDRNLNPLTNRFFKINSNVSLSVPWLDEDTYDLYLPVDFELLSNNLEYVNTIKVLKKMYDIRLNELQKTNIKIDMLISQIENELNELN